MSSGLAHEINNPLTIIKFKIARVSRLLTQDSLDRASLATELETLNRSVDKIATVVRGLRVFSGGEDGMTAFTPQDVTEIVTETLGLCQEKYIALGIELRLKNASSLKTECRRVEIMQVLFNLLGNAVDAVQPLSEKWIEVEIKELRNDIELSVTDSGSGIDAALAKSLMQPFFTTKEPGKGTGLGLSIAKGIAESHGGFLAYDASAKNTRFVLTLPKVQMHPQLQAEKLVG